MSAYCMMKTSEALKRNMTSFVAGDRCTRVTCTKRYTTLRTRAAYLQMAESKFKLIEEECAQKEAA